MDIFGFSIPLWLIFLCGILIVFVAWKLIKFAIKVLLILIVFFVIIIGLDFFNVFELFQKLFSSLI